MNVPNIPTGAMISNTKIDVIFCLVVLAKNNPLQVSPANYYFLLLKLTIIGI
jgi:hypothetical protein